MGKYWRDSMDWFISLITNPYLTTSLLSWFYAQVIKVIIYAIINKRFQLERLYGDGGMPSGHSATVSSLAMICLLIHGPGSVEFSIALILAVVVCHDAMGVRQEAGKQAVLINEMISILESDELPEIKLKELVGHSPLQVSVGILIGILNALLMHAIMV